VKEILFVICFVAAVLAEKLPSWDVVEPSEGDCGEDHQGAFSCWTSEMLCKPDGCLVILPEWVAKEVVLKDAVSGPRRAGIVSAGRLDRCLRTSSSTEEMDGMAFTNPVQERIKLVAAEACLWGRNNG
jgi:hypothetical protein